MSDEEKIEIDNEKLVQLFLEERKFLHDISNYVVVVQGVASYMKRLDVTGSEVDQEKLTKRAEALATAAKKLINDINNRRASLKEVT